MFNANAWWRFINEVKCPECGKFTLPPVCEHCKKALGEDGIFLKGSKPLIEASATLLNSKPSG